VKRAVALLIVLLVAANLLGKRLREDAPPAPKASRIGLGPLVGGVMTGAFRPMLMNYLYIRADILAGQGRYDEEVTLFRAMTQLYPHNEGARAFIGWWLAFNAKGEAQDPALGWRWARDGLDILLDIEDQRPVIASWFMAQCGQNALDFQRYAGREWTEEKFYRARASTWGERQFDVRLGRFDLGLYVLGDPSRFSGARTMHVRLLFAGLIDDWMRTGGSPKLDAALAGIAWAEDVWKELDDVAEEYRQDAARLRAIADGSFDPAHFPKAMHHDANALWALGMHKRDMGRLRAALTIFERLKDEHRFAEEKASIGAWIQWIEGGASGTRPRMPFDA